MDQRKPTQRHGAEDAAQTAKKGSEVAREERNVRSTPSRSAPGGERVSSSPDYTDAAHIRQLHQEATHELGTCHIETSLPGVWPRRSIHLFRQPSRADARRCGYWLSLWRHESVRRAPECSRNPRGRVPCARNASPHVWEFVEVATSTFAPERKGQTHQVGIPAIPLPSSPLPCSLGDWLVGGDRGLSQLGLTIDIFVCDSVAHLGSKSNQALGHVGRHALPFVFGRCPACSRSHQPMRSGSIQGGL